MVLNALQEFLGLSGELPLGAHLRNELGMDSLLVVTVLLDLEGRLGLDLRMANFQLAELDTVQDLVDLALALSTSRQ